MWNDTLELGTASIIVNKNGVEEEKTIYREVFCNEKSVGTNEFYKSNKNGIEIKIIFIIKKVDYENEKYILYDNYKYEVVRTYKTNSEDIELHCTLKEGFYEC